MVIKTWHDYCYIESMSSIEINLKSNNLYKEFFRKSIHMTIAFVPTLASVNRVMTLVLLLSGLALYSVMELLRATGVNLGVISDITSFASRERDRGFTLGPVTLAVGSLLALVLFSPLASTCAIYALAFGDGLSSVTGKLWGRVKIPFTGGKSLIGFFTCFTMILSTSYGVTGSLSKALLAATAGALTELIPVKDIDNILIPVVVALTVTI